MEQSNSKLITLPGAIIVAGALVAMAIIWTNKAPALPSNQKAALGSSNTQTIDSNIPPVSASDHILGNPNASVKIVEYSDPSCPYCKMFNPTMEQIMSTYGSGGRVAWVYRHFPLDNPGTRPDGGILHPNAGHEAQALECAASLGGNTAFWNYEKAWYEAVPDDVATRSVAEDTKQLVSIAKTNGIDVQSFNDCLSSNQSKDLIEAEYQSGVKAGITGTPSSYIITPSGSQIPLVGAQPLSTIKNAIDALLTSSE